MENQLRILILEDVPSDAELVERELRKGGVAFSAKHVATEESFVTELENFEPNLILADYSLPSFDGISALSIVQERCPEVPFVFVSGAIGEELAIETLKKGATDYVLKQRMSRLVPSVRRALREAEEHAGRQRAEAALRRSEQKNRVLLQVNNAIIANLDREGLFGSISQALREVVPFDRTTLALYDPEKDVLRVITFEGPAPAREFGSVGTELGRESSPVGWVFDHDRPFIRDDLEREREFPVEEELLREGIRSLVVVPLRSKGKILGTLNLGSEAPGRYSEDDAEFLVEVATQIALAIENMQAYEEIAQLKARLERENLYLQQEIKIEHDFEDIVGQAPAIKKVLNAIETVAPTDATVLICGETGTGKELVARAIHNLSHQKNKALVKVNCAALPSTLIESELFGHERGAFTGAIWRKMGRFELAHGGTIFLDEISDLPLELQAKLLRVLQEGEFERVGGSRTIKVDVRVIAASNRELDRAVEEGTFRADLYYRLNVFPIEVPSLRERRPDIALLVQHFVSKYEAKLGKRIETVSQETMAELTTYNWPGNIRELENVIERGVILSQGVRLELGEWLPRPNVGAAGSRIPTLDELQREHILEVLELTDWRVSGERGAARLLGIKPTTLDARMKKLGIQRKKGEKPRTSAPAHSITN